MKWFWHKLGLASGLALTALSLPLGCGGRSANEGAGGEAGTGGSSQGGAAGAGGNSCVYGGKIFAPGSSFPSTDGCNMCSCLAGSAVGCTARACDLCSPFFDTFAAAADEAKRCDPTLNVPQCTFSMAGGLACSCNSFFNLANIAALDTLKNTAAGYAQQGCGTDIVCGACLPPTGASCSPAGRCEDTFGNSAARSCKVAGVVYPDGASGIPDPLSCNQCSCSDGRLTCTEIGCPHPCPAGSAFGQQCAQCGPMEACLVVELGCFPTCVDGCAQPGTVCIGGLCLSRAPDCP